MANAADFSLEAELHAAGRRAVAGIDEAGRGPLAGPVVAAAVILNPAAIPDGLADSKTLSAQRRETLFGAILATADVAFAAVSARVIDEINIRQATLRAMARSVRGLPRPPDFVLVDGRDLPPVTCAGEAVIGGDGKSVSIAAASIVAKVVRDRMMDEAARAYPGYGFDSNAGYGTAVHRAAIDAHGPCPIHRMTFSPLKELSLLAD